MAKAQWFIGCGTEAVSTLQRNASRPTSNSQEVPSDLPQELPGRHELHGCTMGAGITAEDMITMQWTRPYLVAQIRFAEWTDDNRLRHAAFLGLRTDKAARDVVKET